MWEGLQWTWNRWNPSFSLWEIIFAKFERLLLARIPFLHFPFSHDFLLLPQKTKQSDFVPAIAAWRLMVSDHECRNQQSHFENLRNPLVPHYKKTRTFPEKNRFDSTPSVEEKSTHTLNGRLRQHPLVLDDRVGSAARRHSGTGRGSGKSRRGSSTGLKLML